MEILGLDGDTLGMDGSQVGVFEQRDEISLCGFLESHDSRRLEAEISLVVCEENVRNNVEEKLDKTHPEQFHGRDVGRGACG